MKPFLICSTTFDDNRLPIFETSMLDDEQLKFYNGCMLTFNEMLKNPKHKEWTPNFSHIMYQSDDDFASVMLDAKDPIIAKLEMEAIWIDNGLELTA